MKVLICTIREIGNHRAEYLKWLAHEKDRAEKSGTVLPIDINAMASNGTSMKTSIEPIGHVKTFAMFAGEDLVADVEKRITEDMLSKAKKHGCTCRCEDCDAKANAADILNHNN